MTETACGISCKLSMNRKPRLFAFGITLVGCCFFAGSAWFNEHSLDITNHLVFRPRYNEFTSPTSEEGRYDISSESVSGGRTYVWPWFSLRKFWRPKIPSEVQVRCRNDTIIFKNAYLNVTKIQDAPVVIFAGGFTETRLWKELKVNRNLSQIWVFNSDEGALTTTEYFPPLEEVNGLQFNITFTYHTKSEVSVPYGYYKWYPAYDSERHDGDIDYHKQKQKFAAFMSSHCDTIAWPRGEFAKDLAEHIPLDRFGRCGNLSCPREGRTRRTATECTEILKQYKFIIGLENICCEEYITEKFWHTLAALQSIPVVLGANKEDYIRVGPPDSFIHAGDFNSMEELAIYLKRVAEHPVLYNHFFKWKKRGYVRETTNRHRRIRYNPAICRLHDYIQSGSLENVAEHFDIYGRHWLGGCRGCSNKKWITTKYGKAPGRYTYN